MCQAIPDDLHLPPLKACQASSGVGNLKWMERAQLAQKWEGGHASRVPCALPTALWIAILIGEHPWHQVPQPPSLNLPGLFSHLSPSVERPSSNLAVPRLLFAAKSRKWPSRLDVPRALIKVAPQGGEFYLCEVPETFPKAEVPRHPLLISSKSNWKVPRKPLGKILTNVPQSGDSGKVRQVATSRLLVYMLSWLFTRFI